MNKCIAVVDLFCGTGGLTHGFEKAGLPVRVGYDIDPVCKFSYEFNNHAKFVSQNIETLNGSDLEQYFTKSDIKVLVGCAPCQPFSSYSRRYNDSQSQWKLLYDFIRIIKECSPDIISMENVIQLKHHSVFQEFLMQLEILQYNFVDYLVNCLDYGVPQSRKRLVLLASKFGKINLIPPTNSPNNYQTVRQTIGSLEPLSAGQSSQTDRIHKCSKLSEVNLCRIRNSKPGGTWRDWPQDLIAECHLKASGKTYPGVYGRMEWDKPSPTITTQCFGFGNGRFGHPEQDRAISLREAALLQTFPQEYQFIAPHDPVKFTLVGRLIGNAVPVKLGMVIAQSILEHIQQVN